MKRFLLMLAIMLCTGSLLFAQAVENRRYVAVQTVVIKNSTGFFANELGSLPLGTEVTLIREDGKWSEIRSANLTGWVSTLSLSARRITGSNSSVSAAEIALAGKGFSADTEIEYKKSGLDYSMVDYMERISIPTGDLLRFVTEGHLSRGE